MRCSPSASTASRAHVGTTSGSGAGTGDAAAIFASHMCT
jgi:hypothetical protein